MRLGIMQPYFFPHPAHFSLIDASDEWLVFDTSQYTPRTWMNRNRVLHPSRGCAWASVPLANSSIHILASEARVLKPAQARARISGQLSHYRRAPFYAEVLALVREVFENDDPSLVGLNVRGLAAVCAYIGLPFRARVCSRLGLDLPDRLPPGSWAPHLCTALGATAYVNPVGGRGLFDAAEFAACGVELSLLHADPFHYDTGRFEFQPGLSILDALMWNPPNRVLDAVRSYRLERVCADVATVSRSVTLARPISGSSCCRSGP